MNDLKRHTKTLNIDGGPVSRIVAWAGVDRAGADFRLVDGSRVALEVLVDRGGEIRILAPADQECLTDGGAGSMLVQISGGVLVVRDRAGKKRPVRA